MLPLSLPHAPRPVPLPRRPPQPRGSPRPWCKLCPLPAQRLLSLERACRSPGPPPVLVSTEGPAARLGRERWVPHGPAPGLQSPPGTPGPRGSGGWCRVPVCRQWAAPDAPPPPQSTLLPAGAGPGARWGPPPPRQGLGNNTHKSAFRWGPWGLDGPPEPGTRANRSQRFGSSKFMAGDGVTVFMTLSRCLGSRRKPRVWLAAEALLPVPRAATPQGPSVPWRGAGRRATAHVCRGRGWAPGRGHVGAGRAHVHSTAGRLRHWGPLVGAGGLRGTLTSRTPSPGTPAPAPRPLSYVPLPHFCSSALRHDTARARAEPSDLTPGPGPPPTSPPHTPAY